MPKRIGNYELGKTIGRGKYSKVKFCVNLDSRKTHAIKIMSLKAIRRSHMETQLRREIAIMKMIDHPNVVRLQEVLQTSRNIYIVMELVTGGELFDRICSVDRFDEEIGRDYFAQLVQGLTYCHSHGISHRDLKPENLLLDTEGRLKITDFGLSTLANQNDTRQLLRTTCGTPNYVAPEVIRQRGYNGFKADVWSIGVILFVMLAGYLPFDDKSVQRLFRKIEAGRYRCPRFFSRELRDLISRMLEVDPNRRIDLRDILRHPWMKAAASSIGSSNSSNSTSTKNRFKLSRSGSVPAGPPHSQHQHQQKVPPPPPSGGAGIVAANAIRRFRNEQRRRSEPQGTGTAAVASAQKHHHHQHHQQQHHQPRHHHHHQHQQHQHHRHQHQHRGRRSPQEATTTTTTPTKPSEVVSPPPKIATTTKKKRPMSASPARKTAGAAAAANPSTSTSTSPSRGGFFRRMVKKIFRRNSSGVRNVRNRGGATTEKKIEPTQRQIVASISDVPDAVDVDSSLVVSSSPSGASSSSDSRSFQGTALGEAVMKNDRPLDVFSLVSQFMMGSVNSLATGSQCPLIRRKTRFMSKVNAERTRDLLLSTLERLQAKTKVKQLVKHCAIKGTVTTDRGNEIQFQAVILSTIASNVCFVEFQRRQGDLLDFQRFYRRCHYELREFIATERRKNTKIDPIIRRMGERGGGATFQTSVLDSIDSSESSPQHEDEDDIHDSLDSLEDDDEEEEEQEEEEGESSAVIVTQEEELVVVVDAMPAAVAVEEPFSSVEK